METLSIICILIIFFGLAMIIASLFTPRTAWFSKNKTKNLGILTWFAVAALAMVVLALAANMGNTPGPAIESPPAERAELQESDFDPEVVADRKAMAARAEEVKPELLTLFKELEAMRDTQEFHELGFSVNNPVAVNWKKRVEEVEARLKNDDNLPMEVKIVPGVLLSLGLDYVWSNNGSDKISDIEYDMELIAAGLNWKWDD
jgi:predicted nucleotidyltransferase